MRSIKIKQPEAEHQLVYKVNHTRKWRMFFKNAFKIKKIYNAKNHKSL